MDLLYAMQNLREMINPSITAFFMVVSDAKASLTIQKEFGSFSRYIWSFVEGEPILHCFQTREELPSESDISTKMSKDLKRRGFKFVGSTICYAFMQAAGLVNDHMMNCFCHPDYSKKIK